MKQAEAIHFEMLVCTRTIDPRPVIREKKKNLLVRTGRITLQDHDLLLFSNVTLRRIIWDMKRFQLRYSSPFLLC